VPQSYILFQASQYDNYSYLFYQPKFISLNSKAAVPANLQISGIRIGVNGALAPAGQSYATMAASVGGANYSPTNGQLLSNLGTVMPVTLGPANDLFFLSFDQLGSHVHAYVDSTVPASPPGPDNTPQPDYGVATFERINNSMARITGVSTNNGTVSTLYHSEQQSLPASPLISAFLPSHQTAIAQLADAYCGQLVGSVALRDAFFGGGLDASINMPALGFFGASGSAQRGIVINALVSHAVGANVSPAAAAAVHAEVDALLTAAPNLRPGVSVAAATTAACAAVLGSAVVSLQ
jgi:hypothetical protein